MTSLVNEQDVVSKSLNGAAEPRRCRRPPPAPPAADHDERCRRQQRRERLEKVRGHDDAQPAACNRPNASLERGELTIVGRERFTASQRWRLDGQDGDISLGGAAETLGHVHRVESSARLGHEHDQMWE
jgi:hypothetical protein